MSSETILGPVLPREAEARHRLAQQQREYEAVRLEALRRLMAITADRVYVKEQGPLPYGVTTRRPTLTLSYWGGVAYAEFVSTSPLITTLRERECECLWYITLTYPNDDKVTTWINAAHFDNDFENYIPIMEYAGRLPKSEGYDSDLQPLQLDCPVNQLDDHKLTLSCFSSVTRRVYTHTSTLFDMVSSFRWVAAGSFEMHMNFGLPGAFEPSYHIATPARTSDSVRLFSDILEDLEGEINRAHGMVPRRRRDPQGLEYGPYKAMAKRALDQKYGARPLELMILPKIVRVFSLGMRRKLMEDFLVKYPPPTN